MVTFGFALFETAIGPCAIAWGKGGIAGIQLPEHDRAATMSRMQRRFPEAAETRPPPGVDLAIRDIAGLLSGEPCDLTRVDLDMSGVPEFHRRVYAIARLIRPGATSTYGEVAGQLGDPGAARAVGQALGANPFPIVVPCHRVLAADGKVGGFSANGGQLAKVRLLNIEHARIGEAPTLFDNHGGLPLGLARRTAGR
jgi:methylated-DNA-[protein]-cysteine S-methyltransferase